MMQSLQKSSSLWLVCCVFFLFFFSSTTTSAQTLGSVSLAVSPENPEPKEKVVVSLEQQRVNTFGSTIRWYIDDVEFPEYKNERSIELITGDLGEEKLVYVSVTQNSGLVLTNSLKVRPVVLDIILEANTYVPYFYRGRPLPSNNSPMRVVAVLHDGHTPNPNYSYKWTLAGGVLFGGPVKGKNVADITMPPFDRKALVVEVFNSSRELVAKNSIVLIAEKPELYFYEESSLLGLGKRSLGGTLTLLGDETTISGEPYYLSPSSSGAPVEFDWKIDGRSTPQNKSEPNKITLRRVGETGSAQIDLRVFIENKLSQFVENGFLLLFK